MQVRILNVVFIFLFGNVFKLCTSEFVCVLKLTLGSGNWTEKLKSDNINLMCRKWNGYSNVNGKKETLSIFTESRYFDEKSKKIRLQICVCGDRKGVLNEIGWFFICKDGSCNFERNAFSIGKRTHSINRI